MSPSKSLKTEEVSQGEKATDPETESPLPGPAPLGPFAAPQKLPSASSVGVSLLRTPLVWLPRTLFRVSALSLAGAIPAASDSTPNTFWVISLQRSRLSTGAPGSPAARWKWIPACVARRRVLLETVVRALSVSSVTHDAASRPSIRTWSVASAPASVQASTSVSSARPTSTP